LVAAVMSGIVPVGPQLGAPGDALARDIGRPYCPAWCWPTRIVCDLVTVIDHLTSIPRSGLPNLRTSDADLFFQSAVGRRSFNADLSRRGTAASRRR